MSKIDELKDLIDRAHTTAQRRTTFEAKLGDGNGNLLYFLDGAVQPGYVWARWKQADGNVTVRVVRCTKVVKQYNLDVIVGYDRDGYLEVQSADTTLALGFTGGRNPEVGEHAWTHARLGPDPITLKSLQLSPFLVHPTNPVPTTSVYVEGGKITYNGIEYVFDGDTLDLSGDIPGSNQIAVLVCYDPSNGTLSSESTGLVWVATDTNAIPWTFSVVNAIEVSGKIRLGAVRLYASQTVVELKDVIYDLRPWLVEGSGNLEGQTLADMMMLHVLSW